MAALIEREPATHMDQSWLAQLFETHYDRVFCTAYRITGNAGDAEDAAQTVFLRLARRAPGADVVLHPQSYLHRAAVHAALDLVRSKRATTSVPLEDAAMEPGHSLSVRAAAGEAVPIRLWLRQAISALSPRQAEIFTLRYLEGYENREIARMLGTSQIVIGVTLHRVRSMLKGQLEAMQKRA